MPSDLTLQLGPEQLVVVGYGRYASPAYDLGIDETIRVPKSINPVEATFVPAGSNTVSASVTVPAGKHIRIFFQQFGADGFPRRSWGGAPPDGKKIDAFLQLSIQQNGKDVKYYKEYDKMIWSGLSWAAGEAEPASVDAATPLEVVCRSTETDPVVLRAWVYAVNY